MSPRFSFFKPVVFALVCTSAFGQDDPGQRQFLQAWPGMCRSLVGQALNNDIVRASTAHSPIPEPVVCDCVASKVRADRNLKFLFEGDSSQMRARMSDKSFELYFKGKLMSYSLACVGSTLEQSVDSLLP